MAGVESATAPPQAPPPPPRTAALATAPPQAPPPRTPAPAPRVVQVVTVVVVFGFFGFAWLSSAANAAVTAAEWGYGRGSIQAAATKEIALGASVLLGVFLHAMALVILSICWRDASRGSEALQPGGGTAAQQPGRVKEDPVHGCVIVSLVVLLMIIAVCVLMQVIPSAKGARDVRPGYLLLETAFVIGSAVFCFVASPLLIIRLVAATRSEERESVGSH